MTPIVICPERQVLLDLASNQLPPEQLEPILEHLALCPACTDLVRELPCSNTLAEIMRKVATLSDGPDAPLVDEVVRRIAQRADSSALFLGEGPASDHEVAIAQYLAPAQGPNEIGWLGAYRVLRVLGSGGMGTVFEADDTQLQRRVALKVMKPALAANPRAQQRFLREARACAAITHDHIVTIYQVGEERGVPFLAMQFLEGTSLDTLLQASGRLPIAQVLSIGRQTASGLAAAHERGLVHRDVKPGNLWLEASPGRQPGEGRVKILDFGLAHLGDGNERLTQPGMLMGTPAYMAPEQARGQKVDERADLFSLGCVLYELTTGQRPFGGDTTMAVLAKLATTTPDAPNVLQPEVPKELSALIMRLLDKDPEKRPASATEVEQALAEMGSRGNVVSGPNGKVSFLARKGRVVALITAALAFLISGVLLGPTLIERSDKDGKVPEEAAWSSPFDRFQAKDIREADRFDGQPKELVGVLGARRPPRAVEVLAVSSDGKFLVTRKGGGEVSLLDVATGKERPPLPLSNQEIIDVQFVNGDKTLAVNLGRGHWFFDVASGEKRALDGYNIDNAFTAFPLDGKNAAGVVNDRVHVWSLESGNKLFSASIDPKPDHRCYFDGTTLLVVLWTSESSHRLRAWDIKSGQEHPIKVYTARDYAFSSDCNTFLAQSGDGKWKLWGLSADRERFVVPNDVEAGTFAPTWPQFSSDGKTLVMTLVDGTGLGLINTTEGKLYAKLQGHTGALRGRVFSPDSKLLATWGSDNRVIVWNIADGRPLQTWSLSGPVYGVLFTPDGRHVILNLSNGPAYILRLTPRQPP